jgi:hypothetical protein
MVEDVSPEGMKRYVEGLRRLTPAERARRMGDLCASGRALTLLGLRRQHPHASPDELRLRLAVRIYGREVAERHLGPVPDDAR